MDFVRVVCTDQYFNDDDFFNDSRMNSLLYALASSKLGTNDFVEGMSNWDVLDDEPDPEDEVFCTAIIPLASIIIKFKAMPNLKFYEESRTYKINKGACVVFVGIDVESIEVLEDGASDYDQKSFNYPVTTRLFKMVPKRPKGTGPNKYKLSITLSDTYEIEVFGDDQEQAKQMAIDLGFSHWNHLYRTNEENYKNFRSQKIRYSVWQPEDISVTQIE